MNELEGKVYDLIVKRFIACFCAPAIIENKKIITKYSKNEEFLVLGNK